MSSNYAFNHDSEILLKMLGIIISDPTKQDRDTALELCKMVREANVDVPSTFRDNMRQRCNGKKSKQNNLAALLVVMPSSCFLDVRQQFLVVLQHFWDVRRQFLDARKNAYLSNY